MKNSIERLSEEVRHDVEKLVNFYRGKEAPLDLVASVLIETGTASMLRLEDDSRVAWMAVIQAMNDGIGHDFNPDYEDRFMPGSNIVELCSESTACDEIPF